MANSSPRRRLSPVSRIMLVLCVLSSGTFVPAQDAAVTFPEASDDIYGNDETAPGIIPGTGSPIAFGTIVLRPRIGYGYTYSNRVRIAPSQTRDLERHRVSVGLGANLGENWTADYTGTWSTLSDDNLDDTLNHSLRLNGAFSYDPWAFGVSQTMSTTDSIIIETARQMRVERYTTGLTASRGLTERMYTSIALQQRLRYAENAPNVFEWSVTPSLGYRIFPRTTLNGSVGIGHIVVTESPDILYYSPQLGASWQITDKLSANGFIGWQMRDYLAGSAESQEVPIHGVSIVHRPFEYTTLSFGGSRSVGNSYFAGLTTETTTWSFDASQRLFGHITLSAGLSRSEAEYSQTLFGFTLVREDERKAHYVRLSTGFLRHGQVSVGYRKSKNQSSATGYGYSTDQFSFDVSYRF